MLVHERFCVITVRRFLLRFDQRLRQGLLDGGRVRRVVDSDENVVLIDGPLHRALLAIP